MLVATRKVLLRFMIIKNAQRILFFLTGRNFTYHLYRSNMSAHPKNMVAVKLIMRIRLVLWSTLVLSVLMNMKKHITQMNITAIFCC